MKTTANIAHLYAGNTFADARRLVAAGLPVIPILPNGSKAPPLDWKCYQSRRPTEAELLVWFGRPRFGLAIVCGEISGHLEVLDFDASEVFAPWGPGRELSQASCNAPVVHTPSDGRHVYYRCEVIEGNQKLAQAVHARREGQGADRDTWRRRLHHCSRLTAGLPSTAQTLPAP